MQINGVNGAGMQSGNSMTGIGQGTDAYSRQLQKQISDAQKKLQDISSDENLSPEEKMKKRQEIQQEINDLNIQLRQHQIELRREKQEEKSDSLVTELTGGSKNARTGKGSQAGGMSEAGMSAIISADVAAGQARIQGNTAKRMENRAGIIKSENKMESGDTSDKEKELAEVEKRAQAASESQMNTLRDMGETLKKAEDSETKEEEKKTSDTKEDREEKEASTAYTPVDIRL